MKELILTGLKSHIGRENAITASEIVSKLRLKGYDINQTKLWEIVRELRTKDRIFICADGKGYYLPASEDEKDHQIKSLQSRRREIQETLDALESIKSNVKQPELWDLED